MANIIEIVIKASGAGQVKGEVSSADKALRGLTTAAGALGIALGARELIAFTADSMALARAQKDARNALTSTVGSAAAYQQAIDQARDATRGMASEAELATGINTLLNMHLAANSQEAARLSMAGNTLAKVYAANGASAEKYYRLLSGGSPILYDNFGLTVELVNAKRDEIMANSDLSAAEAKTQAIRQLTIETAERYNQSLSEETVAAAQTQAAAEDLKAAWGDLTGELLYGTGIASTAAGAMRGLTATLKGETAEAAQSQAQSILLAAESYLAYQQNMEAAYLTAQTLTEQQFNSAKAALAASDANMDLGSEAIRLAGAADRAAGAEQTAAAATAAHAGWAERAAKVQADLGDEYLVSSDKLEQYVNSLARASMYGSFAPSMNLATDWQSFQDQMAMDAAHRRRLEQEEEERKNEEVASQWVRTQEEASNRIASLIESAIQPTLSEVWSPPEAGMPRMDEAARRLATVATSGFGSEWLTQLNQQFAGMSFWEPIAQAMQAGDEGALKEAATQILTGPGVSQLWDKELIKQRVREQLQAENMRAELVSTIQQELAAEGVTVGVGEIGAAMGGGAAIAGQLTGGMAAALPDAMAESGAGTAMINGITELVKADEKNMKLLATAFAEGFSTYLPAAMGMPADVFLASLVNEVAGRLGIATELRP